MEAICNNCQGRFEKSAGSINRAKKVGLNIYCSKECSSLGRRLNKSEEQKKLDKKQYDAAYRETNKDKIKIKKHEYFKKTYDSAKAAIERKKNMPRHVEYCRRPEYKAKKKNYDILYRAKINYGEFWESALIINEIEKHIDDREVRQENNLHNKSQKRKRLWQQLQNSQQTI